MNRKKLQKRLVLNKRTITHLQSSEMRALKGGEHLQPIITTFHLPCPSDYCSYIFGCGSDWTCEWPCFTAVEPKS